MQCCSQEHSPLPFVSPLQQPRVVSLPPGVLSFSHPCAHLVLPLHALGPHAAQPWYWPAVTLVTGQILAPQCKQGETMPSVQRREESRGGPIAYWAPLVAPAHMLEQSTDTVMQTFWGAWSLAYRHSHRMRIQTQCSQIDAPTKVMFLYK